MEQVKLGCTQSRGAHSPQGSGGAGADPTFPVTVTDLFSPATFTWVLGIELRISGLAPVPLPEEPPWRPFTDLFKKNLIEGPFTFNVRFACKYIYAQRRIVSA